MKICVLTTSYPLCQGHHAGHFIKEAAQELVKLKNEVLVVAPGHYSAPSLCYEAGIHVYRFSYFPLKKLQRVAYGSGILSNLRKSWFAKLQIPLFMISFLVKALSASRGCDIIHAHWSISGLIALFCRVVNGTPVILSLRGSDFSGAGGAGLDNLTRTVLRRVDAVISVSDQLKEKATDSGITTTVETIRNGVNLRKFTPRKDRTPLANTAAEHVEHVILFVGRLSHVKGPDLALAAFRQVAEEFPSTCLVFVGDGDMKQELLEEINYDPLLRTRTVFIGAVDTMEMPKYYGAADILFITSRAEGIPNSLYEAMASGLPAVAAPVGGIPEVANHKITCMLAEESSQESLAHALRVALQEPELLANIRINSRSWAEQNLSWPNTAKAYEKVYNRVTQSNKIVSQRFQEKKSIKASIYSGYTKSHGGGAFILLEKLLVSLSEAGYDICYYAPEPFKGINSKNASFSRISCPLLLAPLSILFYLTRLFIRCNFQSSMKAKNAVIIAQSGVYAAAFSPLKRKGAKILTLVHGNSNFEQQLAGYKAKSTNIVEAIDNYGLKKSDTILAVSNDLANITKERLPSLADKISVLPNAIPALPEISDRKLKELRGNLGLEGQIIISFVGPLKPIKRIDLIIRAFSKIQNNVNASLLIVGSGPELQELQKLTVQLGIEKKTKFVGWQSDPYPYIKISDMLVLSSDYEGSPLVLLEALGLGTPIIGSRVGGIPDIIGDERLLFPAGDYNALADCVLGILNSNGHVAEDILQACKQRSEHFKFDWPKAVQKRIDLLLS